MDTRKTTYSFFRVTVLGMAIAGIALPLAASAETAAAVTENTKRGARVVAQQTIVVSEPGPEVVAARRKSAMEKRAEALLDRAVAHIRTHGRAGAAAFSTSQRFIDRDLYAFALGIDGVMLGSGGWSAPLVGQNVLDELDSQGKPFFREMIQVAKEHGKGQVNYQWYNPANSESTLKTTNVVKVGDVVVGVGFYVERASRAEARRMLRSATEALRANPAQAIAAFQDDSGQYNKDDLYVFVVDTRDERFIAHGGSPALVGTNAFNLLDAAGRNVVREMYERARTESDPTLDYLWINPMTGRIESKRTWFTLQDHLLVGVGSYNRR